MYNSRRASSSATVSALIMPRSATYARCRTLAHPVDHRDQRRHVGGVPRPHLRAYRPPVAVNEHSKDHLQSKPTPKSEKCTAFLRLHSLASPTRVREDPRFLNASVINRSLTFRHHADVGDCEPRSRAWEHLMVISGISDTGCQPSNQQAVPLLGQHMQGGPSQRDRIATEIRIRAGSPYDWAIKSCWALSSWLLGAVSSLLAYLLVQLKDPKASVINRLLSPGASQRSRYVNLPYVESLLVADGPPENVSGMPPLASFGVSRNLTARSRNTSTLTVDFLSNSVQTMDVFNRTRTTMSRFAAGGAC